MEKKIIIAFTLLAAVCLLVVGAYGTKIFRVSRAMNEARTQVDKGFGSLAYETLDRWREQVLTKKNGCALLVDTYFTARKPERLAWASEACMYRGDETAVPFLGLAASYELMNQDARAADVLKAGIGKNDKAAALYVRFGQLLRRNKNNVEAARMFAMAMERDPENQRATLDYLQFFIEEKQAAFAQAAANRLKDAKTESPEVKFVIARGLKLGGDQQGADQLAGEGLKLMGPLPPEAQAQLQQSFADVLPAAH